jgi:parvulin-like peptidyl-prolyl isomerase
MPRVNRTRVVALALAALLGATFVVHPAAALQSVALPRPQEAGGNGGGVIDRVLVRVGDRAILHSDFEAQLQDRLDAVAAQIPQEQIDAQMPVLRMQLMVGLVQEAILEMQADELGISANANEIDRAIANIRESNGFLDDSLWQQALAESGLTESELREQIAGSIVQTRMIQQEISRQVFVSRSEIAEYYEANQDDFTDPEEVLYQQIVFAYQGADRAPVRERAENALAELRAGISLTAVGNKYAVPGTDVVQDASSASWVSPEDIQPEVRQVIEGLTPLTYSDIVEGRFGYHIIQLMDRKEGRVVPLEEASNDIRSLLTDQKMGVQLDKYIDDLVDQVSLEIYAEEFTELPQALSEGIQGAPTGPSR